MLGWSLLSFACGPAVDPSDANETSGGTSGAPTTTASTGSATGGVTSSTSAGAEATSGNESGSGTGGSAEGTTFVPDTETGETDECDIWAQDCPDGEKCMPWANDGGTSWNATKCSPIQRDPDRIGESCTVVDSGVSGVDSCEAASMCWNVDPKTNEGTCFAFCMGDETDPICEEPGYVCPISADGVVIVCLPTCDPLAPDCADGELCIPTYADSFLCAPDASGAAGAAGDPCEFPNVCDPGLLCAPGQIVPDCETSGCCTPFCNLQAPDCEVDEACVPYYRPGDAPPGYENVGLCGVEA